MRMSKRYAKDEGSTRSLQCHESLKIFQLVLHFLVMHSILVVAFCVYRCLPSFVQCSKILLASEIYFFRLQQCLPSFV